MGCVMNRLSIQGLNCGKVYRRALSLLLLMLAGNMSFAQQYLNEKIQQSVQQQILIIHQLSRETLLRYAITDSHTKRDNFVEVLHKDKKWRAEPPLQPPRFYLQKANALLTQFMEENTSIAEVIVTDALGATLYAEPVTSDYWQGDEDKFIEPAVSNAIYTGELVFDESSNSYLVHVSVPVYGDRKRFLGVLIVGVEMPLDVVLNLPISDAATDDKQMGQRI